MRQNFKTKLFLTATIAIAALSASIVKADGLNVFGNEAKGKWIIGAKAVNIDANEPGLNDASGTGVMVGYEFDRDVAGGRSSFEIEYITGDEEQISQLNGLGFIPSEFAIGSLTGTYEVDIVNAFFTYKSAGDVYLKLKGGISYADINVRVGTFLDTSFEDTSIAGGIGIGYRIGDRGQIELEYSKDAGNSDLGVVGLNGLLKF